MSLSIRGVFVTALVVAGSFALPAHAQFFWEYVDSDDDGVPDYKDLCVDESGVASARGCKVEEVVTVTGTPVGDPGIGPYVTEYICPDGTVVSNLGDCDGFDEWLAEMERRRCDSLSWARWVRVTAGVDTWYCNDQAAYGCHTTGVGAVVTVDTTFGGVNTITNEKGSVTSRMMLAISLAMTAGR